MKRILGAPRLGGYYQTVKDLPGRQITYRFGSYLMATTVPEPPGNVVPLPGKKLPVGYRRTFRRSRIAPF